ncbi:hypothetical protein [Kosakonia oryzendophytica]|uniref:hypothetical protein n=1 Tax=Kosakonia oryzendophytica TaxID=1005665 RepID=UPI0011121AE1|nr:hypothetical protein [Kosakonia oryzendophytica]
MSENCDRRHLKVASLLHIFQTKSSKTRRKNARRFNEGEKGYEMSFQKKLVLLICENRQILNSFKIWFSRFRYLCDLTPTEINSFPGRGTLTNAPRDRPGQPANSAPTTFVTIVLNLFITEIKM